MTDLQQQLISQAEEIADYAYGCDLHRLDPDELAWYTERVTAKNLEEMAGDLAAAAWMAY